MRGAVLTRADEAYETARRVYNGAIERHPAIIALCVDAADAIAAVGFARERGMPLAVRGGGHSGPGFCSCDDGLVVDLSCMRGVRVDPQEHTDLFWAIRGGGGNFGVVTSFLFRGHPVDTVYGGPIFWPLDHAPVVLRKWRDFILSAREDLNGWFGFVAVPPAPQFPAAHHLKKMCVTVWCYTGDLGGAESALDPVRSFAEPVMDFCGPIPFLALQRMFDPIYPSGLHWYWKADFFRDVPDEAVDLHVKYAERLPSVHSTMHLYPINGAAHRTGRSDTAWSFRDANFAEVIVGVDPDPASDTRIVQWAREYWSALHRFSTGGAYVNMVMDEDESFVRAAYRDNYPRLEKVKAKYDPRNLFRINQNIKPG